MAQGGFVARVAKGSPERRGFAAFTILCGVLGLVGAVTGNLLPAVVGLSTAMLLGSAFWAARNLSDPSA